MISRLFYESLGLNEREIELGIRLLPDDPLAHLEAARTFWAMKQPQQAISQALRALELDPQYTSAYFDLGGWLVLQERRETAMKLYLEGIRHVPDAWPLREQLVGLYQSAQQPGEAAIHAQVLAEQRQTPFDHILLGDCLAAAGDPEGAEAAFKEAVRVAPDGSETHLRLANLYFSTDRVEEAEGEYLAAASADVSYVPVNELGLFLLRRNRFEDAAGILEQVVKLDPSRQEARINLALCYAALEQKEQAAGLALLVSANTPEGDPMREEADRLVATLRKTA
jgi:tetratricopeptide (TPR) repeat protein